MFRTFPLLTLAVVLMPSLAFGLGSDHKPGNLPPHNAWSDGVYEAVNQPNRVHGFFVNSVDKLFYQGDHAELHRMIANLAATPGTNVKVILRPGKGLAKSPWSKEPIDRADWAVTIKSETQHKNQLTIDIWLGDLDLADLKIPASILVESGGEIDAFIRMHRSQDSED